jgi:GNAT superfamily N-acetyltransferase
MEPGIGRMIRSGMILLKERGLAAFFQEMMKKIYCRYKAYWYECELSEPITRSPNISEQFRVVDHLFYESINWMIMLNVPGIANQREIENMLYENHLIYTLVADDEIAGYLKVGKERVYIHDFNREIVFSPRTAFIMDTFIKENFRGKKLFHLLISAAKFDIQRRGYKKIYCHIRIDNFISSTAYEKHGFIRRGLVIYEKIFGIPLLRLPSHYIL